ncbi:MAG: DUF6171 family protein [Lachnospiraceae bacterium]|nr:DUF6171 family protein [Lachnospiraceae bacterium]
MAIFRLSHCRPAVSAVSSAMSVKPFCIRCLIREMTDKDAKQQIISYQQQIPDHEKTAPSLYEKRLSICKDCKWLYLGTCRKCGSYVEARAFRKDDHCPLGKRMW